MDQFIEKITAFITRRTNQKLELLLFNHPNAGIQIPAGTVENGENIEDALIREVIEETGLANIIIKKYIGFKENRMSQNQFLMLKKSKVYSRPDPTSFDWAELRKGTTVAVKRREDEYTQIMYREYDRYPNPQYVTYQITGWVPSNILTNKTRRHFFHLEIKDVVVNEWEMSADHHIFRLFWAPLTNLPEIVTPQQQWLDHVEKIGYFFE